MTTVKPNRIEPGYEPIPGYVLEKRIGRGGYGEVWRAEAPGGLKKAVKFVFGQFDERRAEQERKSLERIKGVQHPFILTLERFELIENQLVIVTELADGSLEDIYKEHRERGSCGIPRDALLAYMKDTADALDYLHQLYKLQHLDIKPANLLIVGGRVKVADFGLLKDLGEAECSMVGGLTPIYAPPEVFDGRPSMHSDQYSMAVMYQEMLTSTRPFGGRTIAQLATQHVHNAPNLDPLPASDRPSVARALEKSPDRRYDSCTEFVDKLLHPHGKLGDAIHQPSVEALEQTPRVEDLPQIVVVPGDESDTKRTQALIVALGGTGSDCLNHLRSRIYELGASSPVTMHSVLIDTDLFSTQTATMIDTTDRVPRCRVVDARLRSAKDYRDSGTERLKTISRRWIYNVPRNGHTNGMRPLGRLALVDHGKQVMETLRAAVEELKDSLTDGSHPKIYVVGSLTGGTGSGMYIDVVYLLRHLMDESAMENEPILSLLTTNRFQGDPSRPLALHATKSAMAELAHFLKPGNGYPGDAGAGWPSVPAARTPLHNTYVVAQSDRPAAPSALDSVVNYLWADATICGDWFQNGRNEKEEASIHPIAVRSLNVVQIGDPGERQSSMLAPNSTESLLLRWLGNPIDSAKAANSFCSRIVRRCYLNPNAMRGTTEQWIGNTPSDRRGKLMDQLMTMDHSDLKCDGKVRARLVKWLTEAIDLERTEVIAGQISQQIEREITLRLQDGRLDLSSTLAGLSELRKRTQTLHQTLTQQSDDDFQRLSSKNGNEPPPATETSIEPDDVQDGPMALIRRASDIGERLIDVVACRVAAAVATAIDEKLAEMNESYSDASARIAQAIKKLTEDPSWAKSPWSAMDKPIHEKDSQILDRLHARNAGKCLMNVVQSPTFIGTDSLVSELTKDAAIVIREFIGKLPSGTDFKPIADSDSQLQEIRGTVAFDHSYSSSNSTDLVASDITAYLGGQGDSVTMTETHTWSAPNELPALTVESAIEAVRPPLLECGGRQRLYLICRDKLEQQKLLSQFPDAVKNSLTTIFARSSMPMLVHEAQGIELKNILSWLDSLTGDDGRISSRLATRCDVDWK